MDFQKLTSKIKENKALIIILLLSFALGILSSFVFPVRWWDETVYSNLGHDLSKNPLDYSFRNNWSDFVPGGDWPKAGFRAPLLPYSLSILYFLKLDVLIDFFMPLIGSLAVFFVYLLGKEMFNKKTGIYSALFFAFLPLNIVYSGRILTDVFACFFVLLCFLSFWRGFEKGSNKHKILFGIFLCLAVLSRYSCLWIIPVFFIYLFIKNKSLVFLKDKYIWFSVLAFFITLLPWLIYGQIQYGNPLGAFIHGFKAASYWGGTQSFFFFIQNYLWLFSIIGFVFLASIIYLIHNKEFTKREICLLLIWTFFILFMASIMPHKEDRYFILILPAMCIISGYVFSFNSRKPYKKIFLLIIVLFLLGNSIYVLNNYRNNSYNTDSACFFQVINYIDENNYTHLVTDSSPIFYYYTKKPSSFYPDKITEASIKKFENNDTLFIVTSNSNLGKSKLKDFMNIMSRQGELKFNCSIDSEHNFIYSLN